MPALSRARRWDIFIASLLLGIAALWVYSLMSGYDFEILRRILTLEWGPEAEWYRKDVERREKERTAKGMPARTGAPDAADASAGKSEDDDDEAFVDAEEAGAEEDDGELGLLAPSPPTNAAPAADEPIPAEMVEKTLGLESLLAGDSTDVEAPPVKAPAGGGMKSIPPEARI